MDQKELRIWTFFTLFEINLELSNLPGDLFVEQSRAIKVAHVVNLKLVLTD